MKILIAIGVNRRKEGGAASVVLAHARELERRGHQVDRWFLEDVLQPGEGAGRLESLYFAVRVARRIFRDPTSYDVVNLHAPCGSVYGAWRRVFKRAGPPYVMTMQGSEERFVAAMRLEHKKRRATHFAWKNRMWHRVYHQSMYDYAIKTADYGAVAAREACVLCELKHGQEPGRIWFVPNGTEAQFFLGRRYEENGPLRLLFVGTWLERKGTYYLAETFGELATRNPRLQLTVAGCLSSEEDVRGAFREMVREKVQVISFLPREDMPKLYAEHDIFIFPSLVEGMPLSLLEAMATGMPVVTTNSSGMPDVIEDGTNGLLVPAADTASLVKATERLCGSRELRQRLGIAAQETMRRYTWENVTEKLEQVLALAVADARRT